MIKNFLAINSIDDVKTNKIAVIAFQSIAVIALGLIGFYSVGLLNLALGLFSSVAGIFFITPFVAGFHLNKSTMELLSKDQDDVKENDQDKTLILEKYQALLEEEKKLFPLKNFSQPSLYFDRSDQINAYAISYINPYASIQSYITGKKSPYFVEAIVVNKRLLDELKKKKESGNRSGLSGILAHELGHIRNKDSFLRYLPAMIDGFFNLVEFALDHKMTKQNQQQKMKSKSKDDQQQDNSKNYVVKKLALTVLKPIFNTLVNLFVSRTCEYLADDYAVQLNQGDSLVAGLNAISPNEKTDSTLKSLMVLFSTHPPTDQRIKIINNSLSQKTDAIRI